ncbi:methionine ABC transporter ATP-binding protein [Paenibacillus sp. URB8-2]|uniref:methionine ABC transporter ATP-binding protein n=1 Tax=Paenibacillus sp. URB8-2 TaxID=2741301 RepID=UPI0015C0541E|nr:methionine ABC transporter ATP-binding protein [Paenibacillus sp. URB8-2]BCG57881.1 methionine import ATP-binding protein MetN [Paenibacillus sp. URB8-2]
MIELQDIHKTFKRKGQTIEALKGVNLRVNKGDIFGVIGYSGAGKSTLIRMVNYLERPTKGRVLVEGEALDQFSPAQLRKAKKKIGMIFQHFNLLESKTVYDNIAIPLVLLKQDKNRIRERVTELLRFIGLSDKADSYPKELSGGQKQRVGIARALASNPSILLCDEATSALDPQTTKSILDLLKKINEQYHITILIITHEMAVIQQICNKVAVMEKGEIIEQGEVLEVFGNPQHPTTESFVRTVIQTSVPESVLRTLSPEGAGRLFKLKFVGGNASEPIIDSLIRKYNVRVNILFANMSEIQNTTLGTLILQIQGEDKDIFRAVEFLGTRGVEIQELREFQSFSAAGDVEEGVEQRKIKEVKAV